MAEHPVPELPLNFRLMTLIRRIDRPAKDLLQQAGLTPAGYAALILLRQHPGITQIELAALKYADRTTTGQIVDRLVKLAYVRRERDPRDRRAWRLYLTDAGEAVQERYQADYLACEAEYLNRLTPAEQAELNRLLDLLLEDTAPHEEDPTAS